MISVAIYIAIDGNWQSTLELYRTFTWVDWFLFSSGGVISVLYNTTRYHGLLYDDAGKLS